MSDRELLEAAAKAAGIVVGWDRELNKMFFDAPSKEFGRCGITFDPLTDDGDALRLAVACNLSIRFDACSNGVEVNVGGEWDDAPPGAQEVYERRDGANAARRAIVRAAAEIGKEMK